MRIAVVMMLGVMAVTVAGSLLPTVAAEERPPMASDDPHRAGRQQAIVERPFKNGGTDSGNADAHLRRGNLRLHHRHLTRAIADFSKAIALNPKLGPAYVQRGVARYYQGEYQKAAADFSSAIRIQPRDHRAYAYRGDAYYQQGKPDQAVADYHVALQLFPGWPRVYNNRGFIRARNGEYALAIEDYQRALHFNQAHWEACCNLAWLLATCPDSRYRDGRRALVLAQKAVEINPNVQALSCLAAAFAESEQYQKAASVESRAIRLIRNGSEEAALRRHAQRLAYYRAGKAWREPIRIAHPQDQNGAATPSKRRITENYSPRCGHLAETSGPAACSYTIQVSSYRNNATAFSKALELKAKGDPAFTAYARIPGKGEWFRIFIGHYQSLTEAQEAAAALKQRRFRYAQIVEKPYALETICDGPMAQCTAMQADLHARRYVPYWMPESSHQRGERMLIGAFATVAEAQQMAVKLQQDGFDTRVVMR